MNLIKSKSKSSLVIVLGLMLVVLFQNCGTGFEASKNNQAPTDEGLLNIEAQAIYNGDQRMTENIPSHVQPILNSIAGRVSIETINTFHEDGVISTYINEEDPEYRNVYIDNDPRKGQVNLPRCEGELVLSKYPRVASCTFTLVAGDLLLTAGHCFDEVDDCEKYGFIFNNSYFNKSKNPLVPEKKDIRYCKKVEYMSYDVGGGDDIGLIRLDKPVQRQPLFMNLNPSYVLSEGTKLNMIGHSESLPLTWSSDGRFKGDSVGYSFFHNVDSFGGNSGSPVFETDKGWRILGVHSRRGMTHYYNRDNTCWARASNKIDEKDWGLSGSYDAKFGRAIYASRLRRAFAKDVVAVTGKIDSVKREGSKLRVKGFACAIGRSSSVSVKLEIDGNVVRDFVTNLSSSGTDRKSCASGTGTLHRFSKLVPRGRNLKMRASHLGYKLILSKHVSQL